MIKVEEGASDLGLGVGKGVAFFKFLSGLVCGLVLVCVCCFRIIVNGIFFVFKSFGLEGDLYLCCLLGVIRG